MSLPLKPCQRSCVAPLQQLALPPFLLKPSAPHSWGSKGWRASCRGVHTASRKLGNRSQCPRGFAMGVSATGKSVLVPIANGSEEMEAVTIIDTLRRAGAEVTVASVEDNLQVEMSRKVKLVADKLISELRGQQYDLIALPGGMPGAERLRDSADLKELLKQQQASDKYLTAICAAPAVVLEAQGFLQGKKATSHPGFTDKLSDQSSIDSRVVVDGKVITSKGPGTSLEFALSLVHQLFGKDKADEVAGPMVISTGLQY